ncbi:hypothetical protein [Leptospira barantonii]|uniref:Uncharacterized protein n=1 Tax=Leptospira barantonii TaxID=2023184 RepID=A0ABX4NN79_9LEPT|nr:hypothetical protein [Leptospira barantonii]PJZ58280.1 hypothetical protein CH367_07835 [Leptospira barantonii]
MIIKTVNPGTPEEYEIHLNETNSGLILYPKLKTNHPIAVKDFLDPKQIYVILVELDRLELNEIDFTEVQSIAEALKSRIEEIRKFIHNARKKGWIRICGYKAEIVFREVFGVNILN